MSSGRAVMGATPGRCHIAASSCDLLSLGMTAYILVGVHFEERSLVAELGVAYERYMAVTPRFVPLGGSRH